MYYYSKWLWSLSTNMRAWVLKIVDLLEYLRISKAYIGWSRNGKIQRAAILWVKKPRERSLRKIARLVQADIKATVGQITTLDNGDIENSIFKRTTHQTLTEIGYSSRIPRWKTFLPGKYRGYNLVSRKLFWFLCLLSIFAVKFGW